MFEELQRSHLFHLGNEKTKKLQFLLSHESSCRIIDELESRSGKKFSTEKRKSILRRLQEEYKKKLTPDDSNEQWRSKFQIEGHDPTQDKSQKKRRKVTVNKGHFDEDVKYVGEPIEEHPENQPENEKSLSDVNNIPRSNALSTSKSSSDSDSNSSSEVESESESSHSRDFERNGKNNDDSFWDDEAPPDSIYALQKIKQWKEGFDRLRTWARDKFQIKNEGLEFLEEKSENVSASLRKQHLTSLTALLHINMLRRNWSLAYKLVCVIVRFDVTDIRAVWPLAVEVLARKKEEMRAKGSVPKLELLKEQQFLEWLSHSFPVSHTSGYNSYSFQGPVYRAATRKYAPMYVISLLWELLVEQNYSKLRDMTEDLILQPPYSTDGVFYFLLVLCNIAESIHLVSCFITYDKNGQTFSENEDLGDLAEDMMLIGSKENMKARIVSNLAQSTTLLETCRDLNFEYPEELVQEELDSLLSAIRENAVNIREFETESVASYRDVSGYILLNGKVHGGCGPNILRSKFLKKLIVGANIIKGPVRSWVWQLIRPVEGEPNLYVCDFCGEYVSKAKTSNKKLEDHLTQHGFCKTAGMCPSRAQMELHHKLFKEIVAAQDDISQETTNAVDSGDAQGSDLTMSSNHGSTLTVPDFNAAIRSEISETSKELFHQFSEYEECEIDTTGNSEEPNSSADNTFCKEEDREIARNVDEINLRSDTSRQGHMTENDNINEDETREFISKGPMKATSFKPNLFLPRSVTFSPDSTFDALDDADISRNFHQFASQTQDKFIDCISRQAESALKILESQATLNCFSVEILQTKEDSNLERQVEMSDRAIKEEQLDDF